MRFENEIEVAQPPKELFAFLTDVERIAPCLPGASIDGRDGDDYTGSMKVKVGPITGTYKGKMRFLEQDEDALRAVMSARAAEVHGQGDAEATIPTRIEEAGEDASRIVMETDLQMRGRVAQFGRGAEPAEAEGAEEPHEEPRAEGGGEKPEPAKAAPSKATPSTEPPALDAMSMFVTPALKRALPVLGPALIGLGYGYLLGRLRELRR